MADSFYVPAGDGTWLATMHTTGPWDPTAQHGGPPSALLGRVMQRCEPRQDMMVARFTCEILSAIPVGEIGVRARLARPGRSVQLVEGTITAGGREVAWARAWRVLRTQSASSSPAPGDGSAAALPPPSSPAPGDGSSVPAPSDGSAAALPPPAAALPPLVGPGLPSPPGLPGQEAQLAGDGWVDGYLSAIEWRVARGVFGESGPAAMWGRMRYPLLPDEEPGPLERVLAIADSGNGVSSELDLRRWHFINPELTVHLYREAAGEWICLDAQTTIAAGGTGLATSVLSDLDGPVGVGAQSLLIAPRDRGPA
jgi:hypothetical protein